MDHSKDKTTMKRSTNIPKGTKWMEDGDDAHFSDNPAVEKNRSKKKISSTSKGHPAVKVTAKKKVSTKKISVTK